MQGRTRVLLTQGTACANPSWCEIPGYIQETPRNSGWLELRLSPEHPEDPLKDFNWGTLGVFHLGWTCLEFRT